MKRFRYWISWILVRPYRWFFWRCCRGHGPIRWLPVREPWADLRLCEHHRWDYGISWPNLHWWIAYRTIYRFFNWLYYDAWRPLCRWSKPTANSRGRRETFPWYARLVRKIGQTAVHDRWECFHCASDAGNQGDLAEDETGTTFILLDSGSTATLDGTDHWWLGTTICPKCGYKAEYRENSL